MYLVFHTSSVPQSPSSLKAETRGVTHWLGRNCHSWVLFESQNEIQLLLFSVILYILSLLSLPVILLYKLKYIQEFTVFKMFIIKTFSQNEF